MLPHVIDVEEAMREKHLLSQAELQELQNKKDLARHMYIWGLAFRPRVAGAVPGQPLPWEGPRWWRSP